jgi:hypothetical protein
MKAILTTLALSLVGALGMMGQAETSKASAPPKLKCTQPNGQACTAQHVHDLAISVKAAGQGARPGLAGVNTLSLASSDGTLTCRQTNGKQCTAEQARLLREVSATTPVTISLSSK